MGCVWRFINSWRAVRLMIAVGMIVSLAAAMTNWALGQPEADIMTDLTAQSALWFAMLALVLHFQRQDEPQSNVGDS